MESAAALLQLHRGSTDRHGEPGQQSCRSCALIAFFIAALIAPLTALRPVVVAAKGYAAQRKGKKDNLPVASQVKFLHPPTWSVIWTLLRSRLSSPSPGCCRLAAIAARPSRRRHQEMLRCLRPAPAGSKGATSTTHCKVAGDAQQPEACPCKQRKCHLQHTLSSCRRRPGA